MTLRQLFLSVAMMAIAVWTGTAAGQFLAESPAFEAGLRDGYFMRGLIGARAATAAEREAAQVYSPYRQDGGPGYDAGKTSGHVAGIATAAILALALLWLFLELCASKPKLTPPPKQRPERPTAPPPPPPPPKKPDHMRGELHRNDGTPGQPVWTSLGPATIPVPQGYKRTPLAGAAIVACPRCLSNFELGDLCPYCKANPLRMEGDQRP